VDARDPPIKLGRLSVRVADRAHGVLENLESLGGYRGTNPNHAEPVHRLDDLGDLVNRQLQRAEFLPAVAVDLDIQQPGRDPGPILGRRLGRAGDGSTNAAFLDLQPHRHAGVVTSGFDFHGSLSPRKVASRRSGPKAAPIATHGTRSANELKEASGRFNGGPRCRTAWNKQCKTA
jgi:hypothetical protein